MNATFQPLSPVGVPSETFASNGAVAFGSSRVRYAHVPTAHTDGDSYVFFEGPNVLHAGDLFWNGFYPVIDYSAGGWIGGMASALETLMNVGDRSTRIIPGHGPLAARQDLQASREMLAAVQARLTVMAKDGKSVEEVLAAAPTKDLDARWARGRPAANFVRQAYNSILHRNRTASGSGF
jgi:glyoxylase-like metal-dependent hydrolase (beta-lactamase superfamily II)